LVGCINMIADLEPNKKFIIMQEVVSKMGGRLEEFIPERNSYYVNVLGKRVLLEHHIAIARYAYTTVIATKYKDVTSRLLVEKGLSTPKAEAFYSVSYDKNRALEKLNRLKYPIIIKNANGSNSKGIHFNVKTAKEANRLIRKDLPGLKSMVAQEIVYGKEYRILVLGNKIIGALEMIHPQVVGDGVSSVRKLIRNKQKETDRKTKINHVLKRDLKD